RDLNLGKVALYQLSYFRKMCDLLSEIAFAKIDKKTDFQIRSDRRSDFSSYLAVLRTWCAGKMQTEVYFCLRLIRIFDFVEDTLVRQCSNKFDIALAYSHLWLHRRCSRSAKHKLRLLLLSLIRIFAGA
ncbi:hypothetical protein, partial [Alistipes communis]|uniref:hypothetical protein n=1 Tax=Alistipes communis TaxID=2585118 RepID=UPI0024312884